MTINCNHLNPESFFITYSPSFKFEKVQDISVIHSLIDTCMPMEQNFWPILQHPLASHRIPSLSLLQPTPQLYAINNCGPTKNIISPPLILNNRLQNFILHMYILWCYIAPLLWILKGQKSDSLLHIVFHDCLPYFQKKVSCPISHFNWTCLSFKRRKASPLLCQVEIFWLEPRMAQEKVERTSSLSWKE